MRRRVVRGPGLKTTKARGSSEPDDFRFRRIELQSLGDAPFAYACNRSSRRSRLHRQRMRWTDDLSAACRQRTGRGCGVMLFDDSGKVFGANHKFKWPED